MYAKVLNGQILEYRDDPPEGDQSKLAEGKPRWLAVVVTDPAFDPATHVRTGPVQSITETQVEEVYSVRAKNADERAVMIAEKDAAIASEFLARADVPISFAGHDWHADATARENIIGIVLLIAAGVSVPNPRPFTPHDQDTPVDLSHAQFIGLGAAIAARKDALFIIKKARQAELAALTTAAAIDAFNPAEGWE